MRNQIDVQGPENNNIVKNQLRSPRKCERVHKCVINAVMKNNIIYYIRKTTLNEKFIRFVEDSTNLIQA